MRRKFAIQMNESGDRVMIVESGELDVDTFTALGGTDCSAADLRAAMDAGVAPLARYIRSVDFYPTLPDVEFLADATRRFFQGGLSPVEIEIKDSDVLGAKSNTAGVEDETLEEAQKLDDLIDDEVPEEMDANLPDDGLPEAVKLKNRGRDLDEMTA